MFLYSYFANIGHADMWFVFLLYCWHSLHVLFLFSVLLLHNIWFVVPDLMPLLFHFQFLLADLPLIATRHTFFTNQLSILLRYCPCITCFPIFLKNCPNPALYVVCLPAAFIIIITTTTTIIIVWGFIDGRLYYGNHTGNINSLIVMRESCPNTCHEVIRRGGCAAPIILNLSTRWRWVVGLIMPAAPFPRKKSPVPTE